MGSVGNWENNTFRVNNSLTTGGQCGHLGNGTLEEKSSIAKVGSVVSHVQST